MKRQSLNKIEKMLLESTFPTLKILLEEEEKKEEKSDSGDDDLFGGGEESKDKGDDKKEEGGDEEGGDEGGGLDDLFGSGDEEGGDEEKEEGSDEEGGDEGGDEEEADKPSAADKAKEKEEKDKAIELAAKQAQQAFSDVASGGLDMSAGNNFNDLLFKNESFSKRRQVKRLKENISRFLFKNVDIRSLSRKQNLSLKNFSMNERKFLKVNQLLNEGSVDDIINNQFWKDNASVDIIVNNAINLTKNFQDLIDIPTLIMNSVAIKFGKQAAEETSDNKNAANQYKLKLEEFLGKYTKELQQLPDYKNYDVSKFRFNAGTPDVAAVGAKEPGA